MKNTAGKYSQEEGKDRMRRCGSRTNIFTLIELLIVTSIIAILTGLLLPALNSAKEKAQEVVCINNLRDCTLGANMYCDMYNGFFQTYYYDGSNWNTEKRWHNYLIDQKYITAKSASCPSSTTPKDTSTAVYGVVSDTAVTPVFAGYFRRNTGNDRYILQSGIKFPSQALLFMDSWHTTTQTQIGAVYLCRDDDFRARFVHGRKINIGFCSGNVSSSHLNSFLQNIKIMRDPDSTVTKVYYADKYKNKLMAILP